MFPKTTREGLSLLLGVTASALLTLLALVFKLGLEPPSLLWFLLTMTCGGSALLLAIWPEEATVDIWATHRKLMLVSDQTMPVTPKLTSDLILYFALTLEELSEMGKTLSAILRPAQDFHGVAIHDNLRSSAEMMHETSVGMRHHIARLPTPLWQDLNLKQATALLDDITDITVTITGAGLAAGLPGAEGYYEVSQSNLSKVNPMTGKIDKDHSGKWIKGANFNPPDLRAVLARTFARYDDGTA